MNIGGALRGQALDAGLGNELQLSGDLGLQVRVGVLKAGLGVQRLGSLPSVAADGSRFQLGSLERLGLAWTVFKTESKEFSWQGLELTLAAEAACNLARMDQTQGYGGLEWKLARPLAFRLGWNSQALTFGASLRFSKFQVDYAALPGNIYEANRVAIVANF